MTIPAQTLPDRVAAAYARMRQVDRPEIWIAVRDEQEAVAEAAEADRRLALGESLPLAGLTVAVKDNIDVAGMPTTAGSPSFAYHPESDAPAVARLRAAGAIVVGKANLDQFATGLVGVRSPFGAVRNAWDPSRISGGSSSGSAVAVALGVVDIGLGTDTAGSGRVPAALNGVYGVKPTIGTIPTTGVVPACRTLDCVTVFARDLGLARRAVETMAGPDGRDPLCRPERPVVRLGASPRVAVPRPEQLNSLARGWSDAFAAVLDRLRANGVDIVEVDIEPLFQAAKLLYEGAFVAERAHAVGGFIDAHPELIGPELDPTVAEIVQQASRYTAMDYFRDRERLDRLSLASRPIFERVDALLTPTTTWHPTIEQVVADPVGANMRMGRYTNFANLLDCSALAIPAGMVDGLPFGVMLTGVAFADRELAQLAERITGSPIELLVVGAHLRGQPLNSQLVAAGGSFVAEVRTAPEYALHALATTPPKPGLVRTSGRGASIAGELWRLPAAGFAGFAAALPQPMGIGSVRLDDSSQVTGFICEPVALQGAEDISHYGGWRAFLAR